MGEGTKFVINGDGELYSWGLNYDSELGLWFHWRGESSLLPVETTTHVRLVEGNVKMVAAEKRRAACAMQNGDIFVWGGCLYVCLYVCVCVCVCVCARARVCICV